MATSVPQSRPHTPVHLDFAVHKASPLHEDGSSANHLPKKPSVSAFHPQHQRQHSAPGTATNTDNDDSDSDSTATNSSDEFNWDDEDEEETHKLDGTKKAKRGRRLWLAFSRLAKPVRVLLIAIIFGGIFVTPALVFLLVFPNHVARRHVVPWSLWVAISWGVGCALALIVHGIPHFLLFIVTTCYGKAPEALKTQLELFMAVSSWIKLALDVAGAWITLSLIRAIVKPPGTYWVTVNRVIQALFSAAVILLAEKLFVRIIAIRFHQKALADRIAENRVALKALDKLSTATPQINKKKKRRTPGGSVDALGGASGPASRAGSPFPSRAGTPEPIGKSGKPKKDASGSSGAVTPIGNGNGSEKRKRRKTKAVTNALVDQLVDLKDAIGQVALKDSRLNKRGAIGSLHSARRLARQLFSTLSSVYPPRSHLIVEDFYPYFRTEADAKTAFSHFDKDDNGDISKREMREAVQRIYRERKALSASLKDMSSAVSRLDGVMLGVAGIIIVFLCLLIFNDGGDVKSLVPLATIVLGFSFVFGNSAKTLFESLIFIFSTHVYDVGDLVIIDDQIMFVKEFGLFATTFRRVDGQEIVAPNAVLATTKLIHNVRRSGSMWETTELRISYSTPLEVVEELKSKLRAYMAANNREWASPGCEVWIDKMKYQNAIHLTVAVEHRHNWQDWGARWARRTEFMKHLKSVLEELELGYQLPLQPVTFHPSSIAPPWVMNQSGGNGIFGGGGAENLFGNMGSMRRDPITSAPGVAPRF